MSWRTVRPGAGEFAPFYNGYVVKVGEGDVVAAMGRQLEATLAQLGAVPAERGDHRYAPGKWSVKEVMGHLADSERVFAYRALRFARADTTELAGFDETTWVPAGAFGRRSLADIVAEYEAVRRASLAFFASLDDAAAARIGTANGNRVSVRALAWVITGHDAHHALVLRDRYGA